jgi:hypothetical protein
MELYLHYYLFYRGIDTDIFTIVFPTCNRVLLKPKFIGRVSETQERQGAKIQSAKIQGAKTLSWVPRGNLCL